MDSKNMPNLNCVTKKTKGRQKIEIKKMSNESNLRVTFSKRRSGIIKKASELATLCGVDLAVIMFSPGNRLFSFGSPGVDAVIQRYTTEGPPPLLTVDLNEAHSTIDEGELQVQLNCLSNHVIEAKKRVEDLNRSFNVAANQFWWTTPIESMNDTQLDNYKKISKELKIRLKENCENLN